MNDFLHLFPDAKRVNSFLFKTVALVNGSKVSVFYSSINRAWRVGEVEGRGLKSLWDYLNPKKRNHVNEIGN